MPDRSAQRRALPAVLAAVLLAALALRLARRRRPAARPGPPLPPNPYHRFYTPPRRLEELAPRRRV